MFVVVLTHSHGRVQNVMVRVWLTYCRVRSKIHDQKTLVLWPGETETSKLGRQFLSDHKHVCEWFERKRSEREESGEGAGTYTAASQPSRLDVSRSDHSASSKELASLWVSRGRGVLTTERPGFNRFKLRFNRLNHFRAAKKMVRLEFCFKQVWCLVGKDLTLNGNR